MRAAAIVIATLLTGAIWPNEPSAQEVRTVEISGRAFRAIEVAVKELGQYTDVPIEGYRIVVTASKDRTIVDFLDPEWDGVGSGPNRPGFTVEMRADSPKVMRSHFHK